MFSELAKKLFQVDIQNEQLAKEMIVNYAKRIAPSLTDQQILLLVYEYDGRYSFENAVIRAVGQEKRRSDDNTKKRTGS